MSEENPANTADLPYRLGVGAALFNAQGLVFIGLRAGGRGLRAGGRFPMAWQMPQGGIDEGEAPADAVVRELEEETGTAKADIIAESRAWLTYDLPDELVGVAWGGKYRGQKQKWFALRFTGADSDFDLDAADKPEFREWRWAGLRELPGLIVPFKRRLYDDIVAEFHDIPERIASQA